MPEEAAAEPLVSVVIPAYDAERYVGEALRSVLNQTYKNLEVIVVDDGSSDGTAEAVERCAGKDARVKLIRQPNAGVAVARNRGIQVASGQYIALLDADDLWHAEKIALQMATFRTAGSAVGLVYCWYREIDENGVITGSYCGGADQVGDVYTRLALINFVGNSSTPLIRRSCLDTLPFDPGLRVRRAQGAEDLKLYLTLAERHSFALVPQFLVGYRQLPGSMSKDSLQMMRSMGLVLAEAQRSHPQLPARLFRWARARAALWLGMERVARDGTLVAAPLLLRAVLHDPPLVFSPSFAGSITREVLRRYPLGRKLAALARGYRGLRHPRSESQSPLGVPFAAATPEPKPSELWRPSRLDRRRLSYLASLRMLDGRKA